MEGLALMKSPLPCLALFLLPLAGLSAEEEAPEIDNELLIVVGAEGEAEYGQIFEANRKIWLEAASRGQVKPTVIDAAAENALGAVEAYLTESPKDLAVPLWIVFIGHGTYNRREAHFNLAGPDLSAGELKGWLEDFQRPLVVINTTSSSGAFLPVLSTSNRIVVTATKSGTEVNYPSFGSYLANGLLKPEADLNNDGENSVFELFHYAARQTSNFYEQEGRIQTETPLIDDNGDGRGTSLDALVALRQGATSNREPDGSFAKRWALVLSPEEQAIPPEIRQKRNVLETQIDDLRRLRAELEEEAYYEQLEALAAQIADLYAQLEQEQPEELPLTAAEKSNPDVEAEPAVQEPPPGGELQPGVEKPNPGGETEPAVQEHGEEPRIEAESQGDPEGEPPADAPEED